MKHTKKYMICYIMLIILAIPVYTTAGALPDTGQTQCFNDQGTKISCPQPGEAFYGQDANYNINPPSYTKLDAQGNALPDSATEWVTVRDNVTGLIWEVKTDDGSVHDKENTYTWYDSNPDTNGGYAGTPGDGSDTEDFINALNSANFGGYSDWRMPTMRELVSITDLGKDYKDGIYPPSINETYFPNTVFCEPGSPDYPYCYLYWSSTTFSSEKHDNSQKAWRLSSLRGIIHGASDKSDKYYVRAVRGGQKETADKLVDNGDGTVTDKSTGLMWQQQEPGPETYKNWTDSLAYCENLELGGYSDWRLPNRADLESLTDYSRFYPSVDTAYFPISENFCVYGAGPENEARISFWTSSTTASVPNCSWVVSACDGYGGYGVKNNTVYVRAVRGGQNRTAGNLVISVPDQGSDWNIGQTMPITWETRNIAGNVKISLSRAGAGNGTFETIAESTENDGDYEWTITAPASVNCLIKIEPINDPSKGTTQGFFTISSPDKCSGDVNGNGRITPIDALCAFEKHMGICPTSCGIDCAVVCCDVNNDGNCSPMDALCIFKKYLGFESCLD